MDIAASNDQPITLIFGKNGGGKTSLLNAIYWCLYGKMDLEEGKGKQHYVNDYAVQAGNATKSNPVRATVTLYASQARNGDTLLYRIQRKHRAYDRNGTRYEEPDSVTLDRVSPYSGYTSTDDIIAAFDHPDSHSEKFENQQAKDVIERLLPQGLARFFFYPGETLSFPFKDDKRSRDRLQGFLREISGGNKFGPFEKLVTQANKSLGAKSEAYAAADNETKKLQREIDELKADLKLKDDLLPGLNSELEAANANLGGINTQLREYEEIREVLADAESALKNEETTESAVNNADHKLSDTLGNAYLHVAMPVFEAVREVFDKRRYPNDISSTLVEQLRETMLCICQRPLTDHMLETLEPLSPTDDSVVNRMITLTSHATSLQTSTDATNAVDTARVGLDEAIRSRQDAIEARAAAEARLTEAGADRFKDVDRNSLIAQRSAALDEKSRLETEIATKKGGIQRIKEDIARKEAEKVDAAPKQHQDAHEAAHIASEMSELLNDIREKQADVARGQLEDLINQNYVLYKENIQIEIDSNYKVRVHDQTGEETLERPIGDLSGSETALLTYAFAAAAAKLLPQYQSLDKLLTTIPTFDEVENIPLVVDAPFTNLGSEYKQRVMDLMTGRFSQVLAFSEAARSEVEVLGDAVDKIGVEYLVHFEGHLANDAVRTFEWKGKNHTFASLNSEVVKSSLQRIED
jgi:DNA sulfur modification protein DndD